MSNSWSNAWSGFFALTVSILLGCGGTERHAASSSTSEAAKVVSPAELQAYERARPVFQRYCAECHTTAGHRSRPGTLRHFNMDAYPFAGHGDEEVTASVRVVLGATGKRPSMPMDQPGAVQGEELKLVLEWADAVERSPGRGERH